MDSIIQAIQTEIEGLRNDFTFQSVMNDIEVLDIDVRSGSTCLYTHYSLRSSDPQAYSWHDLPAMCLKFRVGAICASQVIPNANDLGTTLEYLWITQKPRQSDMIPMLEYILKRSDKYPTEMIQELVNNA